MSSILGLSEPDPIPVVEPAAPATVRPRLKRLSAALLSSIVPGAGQLLLGHLRAGAFFLSGLVAGLMLYWPVRLPESYLGLVVLGVGLDALAIYAAWNALRSSDEKYPTVSVWWTIPLLVIAFFLMSLDHNVALRLAGFQVFNIPSTAMEQTVLKGDRIVVDRRYYQDHKPRIGEVVVFHHDGLWVIKRVMAVERDTIFGKDGLFI